MDSAVVDAINRLTSVVVLFYCSLYILLGVLAQRLGDAIRERNNKDDNDG